MQKIRRVFGGSDELVSIAMCTYNGGRFLAQQLESIINQTYSNLEIVIVDDCSSDNTLEIIRKYASNDPRIRYFVNTENLGFNKNFELALSLSTGVYIAISDQDDIWESNKIDRLINNIEDHWLIFSNSSFIAENDDPLAGELIVNCDLRGKDFKSILFENFVSGHTTLFRKDFLKRLLPIPQYGFYDWYLGFVALYHHKLIYLNQILTRHRIHDQSVIKARQRLSKNNIEEDFNSRAEQWRSFCGYKKLKEADKNYIQELSTVYAERRCRFSFKLFKLIFNSYNQLFPGRKRRNTFSKLNFAYKYARKV